MNYKLTPEQEMLKDTVRRFMSRECPPEYVRECDKNERHPRELFEKIGKMEWMGLPFPEQYGGSGSSITNTGIVAEEIAKVMFTAGSTFMRTVLITGLTILYFGTEEQKQYYLPKITKGGIVVFALTEPNSGSDAASLTTAAVRDGDEYVINGNKMFCTGAAFSEAILVAARTDKTSKHKGITLFLVKSGLPGIEMRKLDKLGIRSSPTYELFFDNLRVSASDMVGKLNEGWGVLLSSLERERFGIGCICCGGAQAAFDYALRYAKERIQFGQPIGKFQVIQHKLANMAVDIETASLLTYKVGWLIDQGIRCPMEASMAKLFASEAYMRVAHQGLQILGGYGYMMEYDIQRHFRDAKLYEIGGGSSEIQRNIIARCLGL
jgi:alkylation response protein AidB-like acyl-CoA dehydrogenase